MFSFNQTLTQYCLEHKLTCFMLVARDERKDEVNFEADYVSDSFMDKNTKSDVHFSKLKWN